MQPVGISNFHTHTCLCKHAEGTVADYVAAAALDGACTALGFSDHCPYPDDGVDTWPGVRMEPEQAEGYVASIRDVALHTKFPVYAGFECEYDRRYRNWYKELRERLELDYLVLGPHWVDVCGEFVYAPNLTDTKDIHRYFDGVIEAVQSGLFDFVAHPDLIMADGRCWTKEIAACFSSLLDAVASCNIPLEINGEGLSRQLVVGEHGLRHPYPVDELWRLVVDRGVRVVCNADAHRPQNVIANAVRAREYAAGFGIVPLDTIF